MSQVPAVVEGRPARLPAVAERVLDNGLRVLAVRMPGVPLVELRLRVPFAGRSSTHHPRATLLGEAFFTGTAERSADAVAIDLQAMGGALSASVDADRLAVGGSALAPRLRDLLGVLADLLTANAYPSADVAGERDRLGQRLQMAAAVPGVRAQQVLGPLLFGDHPYGRGLPDADDVAKVTPGALRTLHRRLVNPRDAVLVLVGDLRPAKALDDAAAALEGWTAGGEPALAAPAVAAATGDVVLADRPGAVQTTIRMAGPALPRTDPGYAALVLANLVFGGYFSSRLVANIRERRGYTYSPRSGLEHARAASWLHVDADVATEVTAPALLEMTYELGRVATLAVEPAELESARRYAIGSLALGVATQAGLASTLTSLVLAGLDISYLRQQPAALKAVTAEDALEAAQAHLAPARLVTVLLGDAERVRDAVATIAPVVPAPA